MRATILHLGKPANHRSDSLPISESGPLFVILILLGLIILVLKFIVKVFIK